MSLSCSRLLLIQSFIQSGTSTEIRRRSQSLPCCRSVRHSHIAIFCLRPRPSLFCWDSGRSISQFQRKRVEHSQLELLAWQLHSYPRATAPAAVIAFRPASCHTVWTSEKRPCSATSHGCHASLLNMAPTRPGGRQAPLHRVVAGLVSGHALAPAYKMQSHL